MYWNEEATKICKCEGAINTNMRCIEISPAFNLSNAFMGLTLTWDVLKSWNINLIQALAMINTNMRCIEINQTLLEILGVTKD